MKKILVMIIITVLTLGANISFPAYAADVDSVLNDPNWIDYVEHSIDVDKTPGLAVAALNGSKVGFKNWGYANIKEKTLMTENTPVHIGSCSKAFTALSVLLLQEEGKLSIEDSISDYISWWHVTYNGQDADIKIWQLLNHCSGIPNAATMAKYSLEKDAGEEKIAHIAENLELKYAPGDTFEYCNLGYCILAYLTETVSGMQFDEYVVKEIMQPIGMNHSGYDLPVAQGYIYFLGRPKAYDNPHAKGIEGEGFAVTTASDMVMWMKAQLGQIDLPNKLKNAIAASHKIIEEHYPKDGIRCDVADCSYFNGWYITDDGVIEHGGWNPTFKAQVILDPNKGTAVFADCNSTANTQWYAMNSCYGELTDNRSYLDIVRCDMFIIDIIASILSLIIVGIILFIVIMFLTQKQRLAAKKSTIKKESFLLYARIIALLIFLCISIMIPYVLGAAFGYPGFGYQQVWTWGGQSAIVLCLILDLLIIFLIITSIARYIRRKKAINKAAEYVKIISTLNSIK